MAVKYDLYTNPRDPESGGRPKLHARVVTTRTVTTEELAADIERACSATRADIVLVLSAIGRALEERLMDGERVYIKELGYFQMTLQCPPVQDPDAIRAESIRFKSVAFRPEARLKTRLKQVRFERCKSDTHSATLTGIETDALLTGYFKDHETLTRRVFQKLCGFTASTAHRRFAALLDEGKLQVASGSHGLPLYEPAPGFYGRKA